MTPGRACERDPPIGAVDQCRNAHRNQEPPANPGRIGPDIDHYERNCAKLKRLWRYQLLPLNKHMHCHLLPLLGRLSRHEGGKFPPYSETTRSQIVEAAPLIASDIGFLSLGQQTLLRTRGMAVFEDRCLELLLRQGCEARWLRE